MLRKLITLLLLEQKFHNNTKQYSLNIKALMSRNVRSFFWWKKNCLGSIWTNKNVFAKIFSKNVCPPSRLSLFIRGPDKMFKAQNRGRKSRDTVPLKRERYIFYGAHLCIVYQFIDRFRRLSDCCRIRWPIVSKTLYCNAKEPPLYTVLYICTADKVGKSLGTRN